jgi:hypothetical protein
MQIPGSTIPSTTTNTNSEGAAVASQVATSAANAAVQSNIQLGAFTPAHQVGTNRLPVSEDPKGINLGLPQIYPGFNDFVPPAIDKYLAEQGLNRYGDPMNAVYLGGTPLFNGGTGERTSRLDYILKKHPHLACFVPGCNPPMPAPWLPKPLPMPVPMPYLPPFPGSQQIQQMLQQIMNMLSKLLGGWTQPRPQPLPYPMPPVVGLPGIPGQQRQLRQQIRQVRSDIRDVRNEIRRYEATGQQAPRHLTNRLKFLEQRLAKLQAQVQPVYNRPGVMEVGRPPVAVPGGTINQDASALALGSTQPVTSNHLENLKTRPAIVSASTQTAPQPVPNN